MHGILEQVKMKKTEENRCLRQYQRISSTKPDLKKIENQLRKKIKNMQPSKMTPKNF